MPLTNQNLKLKPNLAMKEENLMNLIVSLKLVLIV